MNVGPLGCVAGSEAFCDPGGESSEVKFVPALVGVRAPVGWGGLGWNWSSDSGEETISESPSGSVAVVNC